MTSLSFCANSIIGSLFGYSGRANVVVLGTSLFLLSLYLGSAQTPTAGSLDNSFIQGAGADGFVRLVSIQSDGKILLGGNFTTVRGKSNALITRLNVDGSVDPNFTSQFQLPVLGSRIYTAIPLTNGSILVGGLFTNVANTFRTNIARLQPDGVLDPMFDSAGGPNGLVRIMALQPDGKVIIGGEFTSVNNTNRNRIARLNADGSLDTSFDPGTAADNAVRTVVTQPNGQILVGGLFTSFDGHPTKYLVRLNSNGTWDSSYPTGSGPDNAVYFIAPQADGTVLIGGDFTSVDATNINRIARLNADGSLNSSFQPAGGVVGGPVYHILRQVNGRIIIGGAFTSVNGVPLNRVARVQPDGSLDSVFDPGTGANDMVLSMALQTDGSVVAGGLFATYNGTSVGMFARIYGDSILPAITAQFTVPNTFLLSWPSWASNYALQVTENLQAPNWFVVTNAPALQLNQLILTLPTTAGSKFYRLISQ